MHAKPVTVSGDGEHCGPKIIEALIHPLGGLQYPPPTVEIGMQLVAGHETARRGTSAEPELALMRGLRVARRESARLRIVRTTLRCA
jgi:hypothetical protein